MEIKFSVTGLAIGGAKSVLIDPFHPDKEGVLKTMVPSGVSHP